MASATFAPSALQGEAEEWMVIRPQEKTKILPAVAPFFLLMHVDGSSVAVVGLQASSGLYATMRWRHSSQSRIRSATAVGNASPDAGRLGPASVEPPARSGKISRAKPAIVDAQRSLNPLSFPVPCIFILAERF